MPQSALSRSPGGSLDAQPDPVTVRVRRILFLSVIFYIPWEGFVFIHSRLKGNILFYKLEFPIEHGDRLVKTDKKMSPPVAE